MKKMFFLSLLLGLLVTMLSCEKEIKVTGTASPLISLNDVRALYQGSATVLNSEDMLGASFISGVVISDPVNGNAPEGLVILQSFKRTLLRGIALEMGTSSADYNPGDSLVVRIEGKTLERVNGLLQISNILDEDVTRVSVGNDQLINVTTTTFTDVTNKLNLYESTLVGLRSVVASGDKFEGEVELSDWSNTIPLITRSTASFAADGVPGFADYTGVLMRNDQDEPFLMIRNSDDYESQNLEPYRPGELYVNFPEDWETVVGTRKSAWTSAFETYLSGEWYFENARTLTSSNFLHTTGAYALMTQGGKAASITMNFSLPYGVSRFSFDYGAATATDNEFPMTLYVEYSQDSGNSWQQIGAALQILDVAEKYTFDELLDIKGPVRFRIRKEDSVKRISIDQIAVYQN